MKSKKILSLLLVLSLLCSFSVCFASAADTVSKVIGTAYISFEDTGVRQVPGGTYPKALGDIFAKTAVDIHAGDTIADITVNFIEAKGGTCTYTGTTKDSFYMTGINNITADNGTEIAYLGVGSTNDTAYGFPSNGWMARWNNWFTSSGVSDYQVSDGDVIRWMFTCQNGADIGNDFTKAVPDITGINVSAGSLSPAFSKDVKTYTLTIPVNVTSIKVDAELENYGASVTYKLNNATTYKYNREIPVSNGDTITVTSSYTNVDWNTKETTTETDTVVLKISQANPGILDWIRAFFRTIINYIKNIFTNLSKNAQ